LTLSENSLAGLGERTTVRGINTIPLSELHFFDIQHEEQIDSEGTRLIALAAFAQTRPGDFLKDARLSGSSDDYSLTVTHPFLRSRAQNFTARLTFDARETEDDGFGNRISNDRTRAIRLGGTYDTGDALGGVNLADGSVSQGVRWFDGTDKGADRSRIDGDPDFTKFNLDLSRVQSLPYGFSVLTAATGQYSSHPLFTAEQFLLGGTGFGQAYDSGEISGDSGVAGKVELRYGYEVAKPWLDSFQLYGYYDIGTVWLNEIAPGTRDEFSLASVGTGVRTNFTSNLYGYVEVGFPLTRAVASENNHDPRVFFSVTARF
jgi:hemolysin activation/secretion protein